MDKIYRFPTELGKNRQNLLNNSPQPNGKPTKYEEIIDSHGEILSKHNESIAVVNGSYRILVLNPTKMEKMKKTRKSINSSEEQKELQREHALRQTSVGDVNKQVNISTGEWKSYRMTSAPFTEVKGEGQIQGSSELADCGEFIEISSDHIKHEGMRATTSEREVGNVHDLCNAYMLSFNGRLFVRTGIIDTEEKAKQWITLLSDHIRINGNEPVREIHIISLGLNSMTKEHEMINNQHLSLHAIESRLSGKMGYHNFKIAHIQRCVNICSRFPGERSSGNKVSAKGMAVEAIWLWNLIEEIADPIFDAKLTVGAIQERIKGLIKTLDDYDPASHSLKSSREALQKDLEILLREFSQLRRDFLQEARLLEFKRKEQSDFLLSAQLLEIFCYLLEMQVSNLSEGHSKLSPIEEVGLYFLYDLFRSQFGDIKRISCRNCKSGLDRTGMITGLQFAIVDLYDQIFQQESASGKSIWLSRLIAAKVVYRFITHYEQMRKKFDEEIDKITDKDRVDEQKFEQLLNNLTNVGFTFSEIHRFQLAVTRELIDSGLGITYLSTGLEGLKIEENPDIWNLFPMVAWLPPESADADLRNGQLISLFNLRLGVRFSTEYFTLTFPGGSSIRNG
ncbi:MAG: hypothetical protein KDK40_02615 [Chlamydiia bacterium]|nr:hypothetical protein [Chlamydiia bacterium]